MAVVVASVAAYRGIDNSKVGDQRHGSRSSLIMVIVVSVDGSGCIRMIVGRW